MLNLKRRALGIAAFLAVFLLAAVASDYLAGAFGIINARMLDTSWRESNRYIKLNEFPPRVDTTLWPKSNDLSDTDNLQQRDVRFQTDEDGFILPSHYRPGGELDFVFLGGSTTACVFVEASQRFPYLVSELLITNGSHSPASINAGVSGNNSRQNAINLMAKLLEKRPKYVFILHNVNDLAFLMSRNGSYTAKDDADWIGNFSDGGGLSPWDKSLQSLRSINPVLANRLNGNVLYRNIGRFVVGFLPNTAILLQNYLAADFKKTAAENYRIRSSSGAVNTDVWTPKERMRARKEFRRSLSTLVEIARSNGITPVLMTQFSRFTKSDDFVRLHYDKSPQPLSYDSFVDEYAAFNQLIRDLAGEKHVALIDLARAVPQEKGFIYDAVHLTDAGSVLVAHTIAARISHIDRSYRFKK